MEQKYVIFLLGFEVDLRDRRDGADKSDFIVVAAPEEHPEDLEEANAIIRRYYNDLGYAVTGITHTQSKVKELDLKVEFQAAIRVEDYKG